MDFDTAEDVFEMELKPTETAASESSQSNFNASVTPKSEKEMEFGKKLEIEPRIRYDRNAQRNLIE